MATFLVKILTPEREVLSTQAEKIVARTTEGDVGIQAKHVNYVSALGTGKFSITIDGEKKIASVSGGLLSVQNNETNILADTFEWKDEIDISRAEIAKEKAIKNLNQKLGKSEQINMEAKLKRAINRIEIAK